MRRRRKSPAPPVSEAPVDLSRESFAWFDAIWERLPSSARKAFVDIVTARELSGADTVRFGVADGYLLRDQGLLSVGTRTDLQISERARAFGRRISMLARFPALYRGDDASVAETIRAVCGSALPPTLEAAARALGLPDTSGLSRHVCTVEWLRLVPPALEHRPGVRAALGCLAERMGLAPLSELLDAVGEVGRGALDDLVTHFVAFEGLDPRTHRLMVGLLPSLRDGSAPDTPAPAKAKPAKSAPVASSSARPRPATVETPAAPLVLEDVEELLLHVAAERLRVTRSGGFHLDDQEALVARFDARPSPVVATTGRVTLAYALCVDLGLIVEEEAARGPAIVRPRPAAADFLELPLGRRWRTVVDALTDEDRHGWLGGSLDALASALGWWPVSREQQARLVAPLEPLAAGEFHDLPALLSRHAGAQSPLHATWVERERRRGNKAPDARALQQQLRWVLPHEQGGDPLAALDRAYARGVKELLARVAYLGGAEVAGDVFALTPVGRYYLAFDDRWADPVEPAAAPAKVVVQPNLDVLVIGRAPATLLELSPLCDLRAGEAGPARTLTLSRERIIDAVARGLAPGEVEALLVRAARGADVPQNVLRTIGDWARSVRRARVVHVPVLLTDDEETALTVRSLAGKGVVLDGHALPLDPEKLAAFKRALSKKGIIVDDEGPDRGRRRR